MPYTWIDVAPAIELAAAMCADAGNRMSTIPRDITDIISMHLHSYIEIHDSGPETVMYQVWMPTGAGSRHVIKNGCLVYVRLGCTNDRPVHRWGDAITEEDREYADRIRRHHG